MKLRVYLIGPMRGLPNWGFDAFDEAKARWEANGYHVYSPADMCRALGLQPPEGESPLTPRAQPTTYEGREHLKQVMLGDVVAIYHSDCIALLPGWEHSLGSTVEVALAQLLGLSLYDAISMQQVLPCERPWGELLERRG